MAAEVTVAAFAQEWLRRERLRLRPRSSETYEQVLTQHLLPTLGALPLADVTRDAVRALLLAALDAGYSAATVSLWLSVLRAEFNAAVDDGLIGSSPCNRVGKLFPRRKGPAAQRALTADEVDHFLLRLGDHPLKPLFILGIRTGLRIGELLGLRWSDVDLGRRQITVRHSLDDRGRLGPPKGGKACTLPLSREAHEALQGLPRPAEGDHWVFTNGHGEPPSRSAVRDVMRRTCVKAGIPHASPHALRHTFLTDLAESGADPWSLRDLARHASIKTTEGYLHLTGRRHLALVDGLDRR